MKDLDIFIEEYLIDILSIFEKHLSVEIYDFIKRSAKFTLVSEINALIHGHIQHDNLSYPAKVVWANWEEYKKLCQGGNHV